MRRYALPLAAAGLIALPMTAQAQTSINHLAQFSPATTVLYLPFRVTVAGTFAMRTSGLNFIDPMIRLFGNAVLTGPGLGAAFGVNDDGAPAGPGANMCTGAGGTCHSLLTLFLAPGDYTLALSVWDFTDAEARAGFSSWNDGHTTYCNLNSTNDFTTCNYSVDLTSADGQAAVVPEPMSMILLGTGLFGVGAARRRRQREEKEDQAA